jgi:hypothetical protein
MNQQDADNPGNALAQQGKRHCLFEELVHSFTILLKSRP